MALPLGLPALVAALGLIGIWGRQGLVNTALAWLGLDQPISIYGLSGILLAHVFFNLPLAARLMLGGLERIPGEYWLVGANLGMRPLSIFRFIEWPAIRGLLPGIAGLIFMLCAHQLHPGADARRRAGGDDHRGGDLSGAALRFRSAARDRAVGAADRPDGGRCWWRCAF